MTCPARGPCGGGHRHHRRLLDAGQLILVMPMFVGRLGPFTPVSALALRERKRRCELPEERPVIG